MRHSESPPVYLPPFPPRICTQPKRLDIEQSWSFEVGVWEICNSKGGVTWQNLAFSLSRGVRHFSSKVGRQSSIRHNATTMSTIGSGAEGVTPILLLKTKSTPNDGYEDQLSAEKDGILFAPTFVPVLEHRFLDDSLKIVRELLQKKEIGKDTGSKYGGLIFTSQRAVEAFARLVEEGKGARCYIRRSTSRRSDDGR